MTSVGGESFRKPKADIEAGWIEWQLTAFGENGPTRNTVLDTSNGVKLSDRTGQHFPLLTLPKLA